MSLITTLDYSTNRGSCAQVAVWLPLLLFAIAPAAYAQSPTPTPMLQANITTSRGCLESGDNAVFLIGESIVVSFRISSATLTQARATLFDNLPNGFVNVFSFGTVSTNQIHAFAATVAPPTGVETLQLKAQATGAQTSFRSCSFVVLAHATRTPTGSPVATRTPTMTQPPTSTRTTTATRTPGPAFQAHITTNRGCLETGQTPTFALGEVIRVSFHIDSALSFARATVFDILANGFVGVFGFGIVPTNQTLSFTGFVAPPTGTERLQLQASAFGVQPSFDSCSFIVVSGPLPSRTPTATATATVTATPVNTADTFHSCVGACTQVGVVTIDDVQAMVKIAFGEAPLSACAEGDANGDGEITADEILAALDNALHGCP